MTWKSLYNEEKQPQKINTLLNSLMHKLAGTSTDEIDQIFENWVNIIGEKLAEYSRPTHIKNNCLYIQVDDSAVAKELQWRNENIIGKINTTFPNTSIKEIKIRLKKEN